MNLLWESPSVSRIFFTSEMEAEEASTLERFHGSDYTGNHSLQCVNTWPERLFLLCSCQQIERAFLGQAGTQPSTPSICLNKLSPAAIHLMGSPRCSLPGALGGCPPAQRNSGATSREERGGARRLGRRRVTARWQAASGGAGEDSAGRVGHPRRARAAPPRGQDGGENEKPQTRTLAHCVTGAAGQGGPLVGISGKWSPWVFLRAAAKPPSLCAVARSGPS